jgi:dTDP-4-dehydrorhamnose 3,5-epimerase
MYAVKGEIFDVAIDIRRGSPDFGKWTGVILSDNNKRQFYIPPGFAHGFCVLSEEADIIYKCTDFYAPDDEYGIIWNDPEINIDWPITDPNLSGKDSNFNNLNKIPDNLLPVYDKCSV